MNRLTIPFIVAVYLLGFAVCLFLTVNQRNSKTDGQTRVTNCTLVEFIGPCDPSGWRSVTVEGNVGNSSSGAYFIGTDGYCYRAIHNIRTRKFVRIDMPGDQIGLR